MADEDDAIEGGEEEAAPGVTVLTDPAQQHERRKRLRHDERERAEVLLALLSTPAGRRWFAWLLHEVCGLYRPVANAAFDPHGLHYREGARAVGQVLHTTALKHAKNQYMVVLTENLN